MSLVAENQRLRQQVTQLEAQLLKLTEQGQSEPTCLEDRHQFWALVNTAAIAILVVDHRRYIIFANPRMEAMFGYSTDELIGQSLGTLLPERMRQVHERHLTQFFEQPHSRPMGEGLDLIAQHRDGSQFPVEISLSVIEHEGTTQVAAFVVDITERKQAEQQQQQLSRERERVETIKQAIAQIGHDLRTPLASITTRVYLLKQSLPGPPQEHLLTLERDVRRLTSLIEAVVTMTRLDTLEELALEPVNVNDLITMVVTNLLKTVEAKEQTIVMIPGDTLPAIAANRDELAIALEQVMLSALHFTPEIGKIIISTWQQEPYVVVQVQDTGIGIERADIASIFDRFYRVDQARGTSNGLNGLGLAMVKRVMELHEGVIEVESQPNQGSAFRFYLPQAV